MKYEKKVSTAYAETVGLKPSAYSLIVVRCRILTSQIYIYYLNFAIFYLILQKTLDYY